MATMTRMSRFLRRAVERLWRRLGAYLGPVVPGAGQDGESRRRVRARARFWTELREGQREAQAYSERRR